MLQYNKLSLLHVQAINSTTPYSLKKDIAVYSHYLNSSFVKKLHATINLCQGLVINRDKSKPVGEDSGF